MKKCFLERIQFFSGVGSYRKSKELEDVYRRQRDNASIAPVIGWVGLKVAGIKVKSKPKLFFKQ
jgi:hypothetical protein